MDVERGGFEVLPRGEIQGTLETRAPEAANTLRQTAGIAVVVLHNDAAKVYSAVFRTDGKP
jgi:hypothetical protein